MFLSIKIAVAFSIKFPHAPLEVSSDIMIGEEIYTFLRLLQPENACSPMIVTLFPIVTLVRLVQ